MENKTVDITFDAHSLELLKKIDPIHRHSVLNIGLAMVSRTPLWNTLIGKTATDVENVASLDDLVDTGTDKPPSANKKPTNVSPQAKKATSWDSF